MLLFKWIVLLHKHLDTEIKNTYKHTNNLFSSFHMAIVKSKATRIMYLTAAIFFFLAIMSTFLRSCWPPFHPVFFNLGTHVNTKYPSFTYTRLSFRHVRILNRWTNSFDLHYVAHHQRRSRHRYVALVWKSVTGSTAKSSVQIWTSRVKVPTANPRSNAAANIVN